MKTKLKEMVQKNIVPFDTGSHAHARQLMVYSIENDIQEGKLKLIIDKLNSIILDRIGEEIFPKKKKKQDLDQILQRVEDELSKIDLSERDRDID